jgi:hypothetical protein
LARCQWLKPVILATQEAVIRKISVQNQPRQIVLKTISQKYSAQKGLAERQWENSSLANIRP